MTRKEFLKLCALLSVSPLLAKNETRYKMPALFVSHGSPMNIIQGHMYAHALKKVVKTFKRPKAILVISAHWYDSETFISASKEQETIYDFYGFPEELYKIKYNPKGSPEYAATVESILAEEGFLVDRGLDHGAWSVLYHMYPKQDIPSFQISINKNLSYQDYYDIGKQLSILREQGILIIGSGGATHNLREVKYPPNNLQFDEWAVEFDNFVAESFSNKNFENLINAKEHKYFKISHPFDDHFIPLLYTAGVVSNDDKIEHFHEDIALGNMSMRCIKIG
ncbi:4,5-DOPA dioxygenase extradiol [Halarcobacter sp.]|uniref:4,5-DOPA-extradiol-dioxygenase n=1 Tax=Halarcobacter sp. TaxID=2321133 RepID=UPI0029F58BEA|nr:4,5-DOPA dioxygenase extradiol [Halarcobacter sp.]